MSPTLQSIEHEGPKYRRRVIALGCFLGLLSIANIGMCSYYSYISGACSSISALVSTTCKYDPSEDWQACFVQADNTVGKMASVFPTSMAFTGQQTLVYTWLAFAILFRSLNHYEWLLSTISFMLYAILGVVAYYSFNPFLPLPHQTAATVASLTAYIKPDMYDHLDNTGCDTAYHFNLAFLCLQYTSVFVVLLLLIIAFSAECIRRRYPLSSQLPPLRLTRFPVIIACIALSAYAVMVFAKASASITNINIVQDSPSNPEMFPFAQGSVDIATVFLIVATMSVIRGTTRQSTSAFRLASVASLLHVALVYPTVIGNLEIMNENKMWQMGGDVPENSAFILIMDDGCKKFWTLYFGSYYGDFTTGVVDVLPSDQQASDLCYDTWVSFVAQSVIFVIMHIQIIACLVVYKNNKGRPTDMGFDPQPPTAPNAEPLLAEGGAVVSRI